MAKATSFSARDLESMVSRELLLTVFGQKGRKREKGFPEGGIVEIKSRQPHHIAGYELGYLKSVTDETGKNLCQTISEALQMYIFTLEQVDYSNKSPPVLRGRALEYDLHTNAARQPERRFVLYMDKLQCKKKDFALYCF